MNPPDAAESKRAALIGVSEGGPLISLSAATHPDRVEGLVLFGTFARGSAIDLALIERFRQAIDTWCEGLTADDIRRRISTVDGLSRRLIRRMPKFVRPLARLTGR